MRCHVVCSWTALPDWRNATRGSGHVTTPPLSFRVKKQLEDEPQKGSNAKVLEEILDRAYGKSPQSILGNGEGEPGNVGRIRGDEMPTTLGVVGWSR
jgi:hypothetical protein